MLTTIHARPQGRNIFRSLKGATIVVCPRCTATIGLGIGAHQVAGLLRSHRCKAQAREAIQPAAAVPFN